MNPFLKKINFIITILFVLLFFLTSARIIIHNNFPVVGESHKNFTIHHKNLKRVDLLQEQQINSKDLCLNIENKIVDRHHLR